MSVLRVFVPVLLTVGLAGCSSAGNGVHGASPGTTTSARPSSSVAATDSSSGTGSAERATSAEVSFTVNGSTTYATLEVPAHRSGQRLAAALLIAGSGPNDRNGNDAGLKVSANTLGLLANILAGQGIMTLRFDKYGAGKTGVAPVPAQDLTISTYFRQADAAYEFLARQPQVDPDKLLVVGHSEGGMIALQVATTSTTKPAGIALLEPQDERILDLLLIQDDQIINSLVSSGQLPASQARSNAAAVARALSAFRAGRAVSTQGMAAPIAQLIRSQIMAPAIVNFQRSDDQVVPAKLAENVQKGTRLLITEGTRDTNVPPNTISPLAQALTTAGVSGPGLRIFQGTDHLMHLANQPDTEPVLAAPIAAAIRNWADPFAATR